MNQNGAAALAEKQSYLSRDATAIIKGIALIMMFVHHFFTFPEWWDGVVSYPLIEKAAPYLCTPMRLCVPVFAFLTGYLYCLNKNKTYKYSFRKITDVYVSYWGVFFPLAIIAAVFLRYKYTPLSFAMEMLAITRPTMYFCWYVCFYCACMLALPLLAKIMGRNIHLDLFISLFAVPCAAACAIKLALHFLNNPEIANVLRSFYSYFPVVLSGFIFARYDLFERMEQACGKLIHSGTAIYKCLCLCGILIIPMASYAEPNVEILFGALPVIHVAPYIRIDLGVIYAPLFIFFLANLCRGVRVRYLHTVLSQIGKYSLLMWFTSCMFFGCCKKAFMPVLYFPHNPVLVTVWGLLLCYIASVGIDFVVKRVNGWKNRLLFARD